MFASGSSHLWCGPGVHDCLIQRLRQHWHVKAPLMVEDDDGRWAAQLVYSTLQVLGGGGMAIIVGESVDWRNPFGAWGNLRPPCNSSHSTYTVPVHPSASSHNLVSGIFWAVTLPYLVSFRLLLSPQASVRRRVESWTRASKNAERERRTLVAAGRIVSSTLDISWRSVGY